MTHLEINEIFEILTKKFPNATTELIHHSNFELLIAVILSAQATDKSVNEATANLFKVANTPEKIYALGEAGLIKYIKKIGLFSAKAKNVIKTCNILITNFNSKVPKDRDALESLPGVGRKTASVVLNVAFGEPTIAVDTHVFRVANRTGLAPGKNPLEVEMKLAKIIPEKFLQHAALTLVLHGRYICKAINPLCRECPINKYCDYFHNVFLTKS